MTANAVRGEIDLELEGVRYVLRPSYEAIVAFETKTGAGMLELARRADDASMSLTDAATIAAECIKAWGRSTGDAAAAGVNAKRVGELILEARLALVLKKLSLLLYVAATGGYTASGEVKAAATKTETPAAA